MKTKRRRKISNRKITKKLKRTPKKRTVKRKYSIKKARMISEKKYKELLNKKRLTKKEKKQLDRALFVKYCKCIKKIKYSKDYDSGVEYPICMSTIYNNRGIKAPTGVTKKCKNYY